MPNSELIMPDSVAAPKSQIVTFIQRTALSQVSSLVTLFSTNFLEVLRTRLIYDAKVCDVSHYSAKPNHVSIPRSFHSIYYSFPIENRCGDCLPTRSPPKVFKYLILNEGAPYLFFSGISHVLWSHVIRTGMFFPIFETIKMKLEPKIDRELYRSIISSIFTRTLTSIASFPLEVTRIQKQSAKFPDASLSSSVRQISATPRAFLPIFSSFLQKEVVFSMVFWASYEAFRELIDSESSSLMRKSLCAILAGGLSAVSTFPFDFVQTYRTIDIKKFKGQSFFRVIGDLWKQYDQSLITNSLYLRVVRGCMMNGIFITLYEALKLATRTGNSFN